VPATPAGLLELVGRLLPAGQTSHHAVSSDDSRHVQVYLDRGQGPAMIRFWVAKAQSPAELPCPAFASCTDVGRDRVELMEIDGNCIQRWSVALRRADGVVIFFNLASCLSWDGTANPPAPKALTTDEAVRIAFDPRWGTLLPRDALARLPDRDRAIVVLRYWEDHSVQTVTEMLDVSAAVVKQQSLRSLQSLRDLLGDARAELFVDGPA
jgi:hypothetical protein